MEKYEIGDIVDIPSNTKVKVILPSGDIEGIVVGKAGTGIEQLHIIKCTDGSLPSDDYPYHTFVSPLHLIEKL